MISILEPDAMYIVKNTGTMVIGVSKEIQIDNEEMHSIANGKNGNGQENEESKEDPHLFQIVASDTTVF